MKLYTDGAVEATKAGPGAPRRIEEYLTGTNTDAY